MEFNLLINSVGKLKFPKTKQLNPSRVSHSSFFTFVSSSPISSRQSQKLQGLHLVKAFGLSLTHYVSVTHSLCLNHSLTLSCQHRCHGQASVMGTFACPLTLIRPSFVDPTFVRHGQTSIVLEFVFPSYVLRRDERREKNKLKLVAPLMLQSYYPHK